MMDLLAVKLPSHSNLFMNTSDRSKGPDVIQGPADDDSRTLNLVQKREI